jgi:cytosine/adenosine deaminase-related metal-dependent hydrolase
MSRTDFSPIVFRDEPVRSWVFHEIFSESDHEKSNLVESLGKRIKRSKRIDRIGIAPFALFSLPTESHKILIDIAKQNQYLWSCHLAESSEELQAFSEQSGDLYFSITRKREWPYGETKRGSMYYAITNNLIPNNAILYHCNYVSSEELSILAAKNVSIVQCGQYSSLFGDKPFPMESALNRGINICLGTETPVGLNSMNLFDELYYMKKLYPHIPVKNMIDWVTKNPAKALRCSDSLGTLEEGKKADIIGIRVSDSPRENILEEIFMEEPEVDFVMVGGEEVIVGY